MRHHSLFAVGMKPYKCGWFLYSAHLFAVTHRTSSTCACSQTSRLTWLRAAHVELWRQESALTIFRYSCKQFVVTLIVEYKYCHIRFICRCAWCRKMKSDIILQALMYPSFVIMDTARPKIFMGRRRTTSSYPWWSPMATRSRAIAGCTCIH